MVLRFVTLGRVLPTTDGLADIRHVCLIISNTALVSPSRRLTTPEKGYPNFNECPNAITMART